MIWGHNTLGSVALRIIQDYSRYEMENHHTLDQAIERVCFRKESMTAAGESPSYIWWEFGFDGGELRIMPDLGKLHSVPRIKQTKRGEMRYVAAEEMDTSYLVDFNQPDSYISISGGVEDCAIRMGLGIGQRVLTRFREVWNTDYFGESDCDTISDVLFAEEGPYSLAIDSGLSSRPRMMGLTVA